MSIPRIPLSLKGTLFTTDFLSEGIESFAEWDSLLQKAADVREHLLAIYEPILTQTNPNEAVTCDTCILPTLNILEWQQVLSQQTLATKGRADVPDYVLFLEDESYEFAIQSPSELIAYERGEVVVEAKRWGCLLYTSPSPRDRTRSRMPSSA